MPLFENFYLLGIVSFVFGLAMSVGQPITMAMSFSNAADGRSGAAMGLRQTFNHTARVAGPLVFGVVGTAFGAFAVFWINALMLAGGALLVKSKKINPPQS
jgi:MFS family permease